MTEPRIVSPEEARERIARAGNPTPANAAGSLLYTVATEPDRTRAAVVRALRSVSQHDYDPADKLADEIESGAPL